MRWKCSSCDGFHTYIPDLKRGLHVPTADYAFRMGYIAAKREPRETPPPVVNVCVRCEEVLDPKEKGKVISNVCLRCDEMLRQGVLFK